jgi:hypothetical protein
MMAELTMGWFGTTHERITQKVLWEMRSKTTHEFQKELLKYINEPDQGLPRNLKNHIQTPDGYGKAKEMIVKCFNMGTTRGLAHALHYTQDICNPLHTVKDYPIDKHIAYELMISNVDFKVDPNEHRLFDVGIAGGVESIVIVSNSLFKDLKLAIDLYNIEGIMNISKRSLGLAGFSSYSLIKCYLQAHS